MKEKDCLSPVFEITRRIEFDAGHRIPHHHGLCSNIHGHRYGLEITIAGSLVSGESFSDNGMVVDFQAIQKLACESLIDEWDHAFIVYKDDFILEMLKKIPNHRTFVLDQPPTVENMAAFAFRRLRNVYQSRYGNTLHLNRIRLYETPNCWADVTSGYDSSAT
ncbi:6-carboxy-5,6,7,8-tetrahydropterin synthase [Candidatus Ichthyocystis hellenicum]|uniref:6-carboxy-5,6,7,8-tetrahydropterin synthase n=1 Tax=Candidatus Ichthyocystis hellenicum TaxID=1561003 RepID=A0A0S4LZB2_9BURK|nr:6-carboxytetrahydropterin synthase [Candidatus Ichthyocystis hellenicum]CUT16903.1 6-carboxy-5,6,7,8-tetrahydropterin synthase [Candidatus Ichthyocystis hellenicum]